MNVDFIVFINIYLLVIFTEIYFLAYLSPTNNSIRDRITTLIILDEHIILVNFTIKESILWTHIVFLFL